MTKLDAQEIPDNKTSQKCWCEQNASMPAQQGCERGFPRLSLTQQPCRLAGPYLHRHVVADDY